MVRTLIYLMTIGLIMGCDSSQTPLVLESDFDNGGLFLPDGFGAITVVDSVGESRHLAVNDNGDIYIKLRNLQNIR